MSRSSRGSPRRRPHGHGVPRDRGDDDLAAVDFEVDTNPEQITPKPARAPAFDDDAARCNPIAEPFELLGRRVPVSLKTQILPGSLTKILEDVQIALLPPLLMF